MSGPILALNAEGGTRTPIGYPTRPSNVRVYQFHHFGQDLSYTTTVPAMFSTFYRPSFLLSPGGRSLFRRIGFLYGRLAAAQREHRLDAYLRILERYPLLVVAEVGYLPFDAEAANLFFQLVSARYERGSLIVTSNKAFTGWGEIFGDPVVAAAMIDRLVHQAEIINLKGDSYRLKDKHLTRTIDQTSTVKPTQPA